MLVGDGARDGFGLGCTGVLGGRLLLLLLLLGPAALVLYCFFLVPLSLLLVSPLFAHGYMSVPLDCVLSAAGEKDTWRAVVCGLESRASAVLVRGASWMGSWWSLEFMRCRPRVITLVNHGDRPMFLFAPSFHALSVFFFFGTVWAPHS